MWNSFLLRLATFFGVGRLRPAPGTWGTLATLPVAALLMLAGPYPYMLCCLLLLPLSIAAAGVYQRTHDCEDVGEIVIDEVIGMLVALTWMPFTWQAFVLGFILFRFFDILKPFPISYLDRNIKGGSGVVLDDLAAGLLVNVILQFVYVNTAWLGAQSAGVLG